MTTTEVFHAITSQFKWYAPRSEQWAFSFKKRFEQGKVKQSTLNELFDKFGYFKRDDEWTLLKTHLDGVRTGAQTDFLRSIEHLRISVFDARIGMEAQQVNLWDGNEYKPHLVPCVITSLYWDSKVSDFSGYYKMN